MSKLTPSRPGRSDLPIDSKQFLIFSATGRQMPDARPCLRHLWISGTENIRSVSLYLRLRQDDLYETPCRHAIHPSRRRYRMEFTNNTRGGSASDVGTYDGAPGKLVFTHSGAPGKQHLGKRQRRSNNWGRWGDACASHFGPFPPPRIVTSRSGIVGAEDRCAFVEAAKYKDAEETI
ncbi:hypothetical protein BKA93DRAFT_769277, partial [Sparassis latifolia]